MSEIIDSYIMEIYFYNILFLFIYFTYYLFGYCSGKISLIHQNELTKNVKEDCLF